MSPQIRAIRRAVVAWSEGRVTVEDWQRISAIEALRSEVSRSATEVTFVDLGAGEPGAERSWTEGARGVTVTRPIATICNKGGLSPAWCGLLFLLIRELRPRRCLELGTSLGFSAAYQALALEANDDGQLVTIDGAIELVELAIDHHRRLGAHRVRHIVGSFADTLTHAAQQAGPLEFVFIDGHHDRSATLRYFETLLPHLAPCAVVVFDDIKWYAGMADAWKQICGHPAVSATVRLDVLGIAVVGPRDGPAEHLDLR